jgi:hypothetical protein
MNAEIVNLSTFDEEDTGFSSFVEDLKGGVKDAIFMIEKEDGTVRIGVVYHDVRDLISAVYRLQSLGMSAATGDFE